LNFLPLPLGGRHIVLGQFILRQHQRSHPAQTVLTPAAVIGFEVRLGPVLGKSGHRLHEALGPQRTGVEQVDRLFGRHVALVDQFGARRFVEAQHQRRQAHVLGLVEQRLRVELADEHMPASGQRGQGLRHIGRVGEGALEGVAEHRRQPLARVDRPAARRQRGQVAVDPLERDIDAETDQALADGVERVDLGFGAAARDTAHRKPLTARLITA